MKPCVRRSPAKLQTGIPAIRKTGASGPALAWVCLLLACAVQAGSLPGVLDVSGFGAAGDGVTDSTAAFQAGLAAAMEQGRPLYVPPGRYLLSDDLDINASIEIAGAGAQASVLTSRGAPARLRIHASHTTIRDLGFEDMVEPVALVSRADYTLENIRIERCRFERIEVGTANRGVIGLSDGRTFQRPFPIRYLVVRDCLFRDIHAHAIQVRANIRQAQILDNQFLNIINPRRAGEEGPFGGVAIRLGEDPKNTHFPEQARHRVAGNVVRHMRKYTRAGNLIGILLYGDHNLVRDNLIEDIDGTAAGDDTNAMYVKGSFTRVLGNTVRDIHGADDDGALCFKGWRDTRIHEYGNDFGLVAHNTFQNIRGMSAMELACSHLQVTANVIIDAPVRGLFHRMGENLWVQNNTFVRADADLRTARGLPFSDVHVSGNRFLDSGLVLSQFRRDADRSRRSGVYIHDNLFQWTEAPGARRMIRLANGVVEPYVSIRNNRFHNLAEASGGVPAGRLVDLVTAGRVIDADIIGNHVIQRGPQTAIFHVGRAAGRGRFVDNRIEVADLRGPVLEGAYGVVENNTVVILEAAAAKVPIDALFVLSPPEDGTPRIFRNNRVVSLEALE